MPKFMMSFVGLLAAVAATPVAAQAPSAAPLNLTTSPLTPGSWSYVAVPGGSEARFIDATATARLVIQCNRAARQVKISRIHTAAAPTLSLTTGTDSRVLPATFEANVFRVTAQLSAYDRLLDAIAFSGRIGVTMTGAPLLVIPSWPEAARAIEDCRS
jgi:hypothetical protein